MLEEVKVERWQRFMQRQAEISAARLARKIGGEMAVLVDTVEDAVAIARSSADAPEIDGVVRIHDGGDLAPGQVVRVRVVDADDYDLDAELLA